MEKKYQVFVSSTYMDLQEERQTVFEALLSINCIPVGMEYFPAADDDQFTVIKRLIDHCDYYILITAGRYGSIEPKSGKSYTQLEYEYALERGIPVAAFCYDNLDELPGKKLEPAGEKREKLENFILLVKQKLCKYWTNKYQLAQRVSSSIAFLTTNNPRTGWVKADAISSAEANEKIIQLTDENTKLKARLRSLTDSTPEDTAQYQQGEDTFTIHYSSGFDFNDLEEKHYKKDVTWNQIFISVAMALLSPITKSEIVSELEKNLVGEHYGIDDEDIQKILTQLMALKLIVTDTVKFDGVYVYWTLSDYGKKYMVKHSALKR